MYSKANVSDDNAKRKTSVDENLHILIGKHPRFAVLSELSLQSH